MWRDTKPLTTHQHTVTQCICTVHVAIDMNRHTLSLSSSRQLLRNSSFYSLTLWNLPLDMIFASSLAASFFSATFSTLHCRVPAMNKSQGLLVLWTQAWFHTGTVSFQDYKQEIRSLVPGLRFLDHKVSLCLLLPRCRPTRCSIRQLATSPRTRGVFAEPGSPLHVAVNRYWILLKLMIKWGALGGGCDSSF